MQKKAAILLVSHTLEDLEVKFGLCFFPLKVTNQIRGSGYSEVPLASTFGGDQVVRSGARLEGKAWFCFTSDRGETVPVVITGTGRKKGVCVQKRKKADRRVLFSCHCL